MEHLTMRVSSSTFVICSIIGTVLFCGAPGCGKKSLTINDRLSMAQEKPPGPQQAAALLSVASRQAAAEDHIGAYDTITAAYEQVSAGGEENVVTLLNIAQAYIDINERRKARVVLTRVSDIAKAIDDEGRKAKTLADVGALFGNTETGMADPRQAKLLLDEATELADTVEERFRAEALAVVAMGYVSGGMAEEAGAMVEKLESCLAALSDPRAKSEALAAASSVYAKTGNADKATSLLSEAASTAAGIDRDESKAYALLSVANATATNGDTPAAIKLLEQADEAAGKVGDPDAQANVRNVIRATMTRLQ